MVWFSVAETFSKGGGCVAGEREWILRQVGVEALPALLGIYEEAFPAEERKSAEALRGMLLADGYAFFGAFEGCELVGFAVVRWLEGTGAALLEYLAVDRRRRGAGVGRMLFAGVAERAAAEERVVLIEVESAEGDAEQVAARRRRKAWYRGMGAKEIVGLRWRMPPVGGGEPPPMELMVMGMMAEEVPREVLRGWVRAVYAQVYGRSGEEADGMLEGVGDVVAVR